MALNAAQLEADILAVLMSDPPSKEDAADGFAQAYADYAAGGVFGASVPVFTGLEKDVMAATLATSLTVPGLPVTAAGGWATSVFAFWMTPPILVTGPQVGTVISAAGAAGLTASMTTVFANVANTKAVCALGMATALHAATVGQVIALLVPPPGGVSVPIA